jgi:tetratricopeptide (TPR) repeat protein
MQKDNVRVVILEVKREAQRLLVGMKYESFSTQVPVEDQVKLGLVTHNSQFPREFAASLEAREGNQPYDWFLQKSISFVNPNGVEELTKELGLSYKAGKSSLFSGLLHGSYDPSTTALALRNEQNSQMAFKHVALGIKYFKSGNNLEAFQCLNKALTIDKDNVEGLVARGALYANNGSLDRAIADFRKGLDLNPDHKNAKKYLSETLIAAARNHEDDKNYELALETYEKVLSMEPDHKIAKEAVWYLKQKIAGSGAAAAAG